MEFRITSTTHRGYKVSECGTVIISPKTGDTITIQDNMVKGKVSGYKYVTLLWDTDGESMWYDVKRMPVHRLVCELWHGQPTSERPWVNHKDGNKANNHYSNLEWTSISDNIKHSYRELGRKAPKPMIGKKHKESSKMKMAIKKTGSSHPRYKGDYIVYGVAYPSTAAAAKAIGKYPMYVHRAVLEKREGFEFRPLPEISK